jgi:uroporphyrinogen-III synthase
MTRHWAGNSPNSCAPVAPTPFWPGSPTAADPATMTKTGPLAGKTIVVTRPRAQAGPLAAAIGEAGGEAVIFPLLEISPARDSGPLNAAIARLNDYRLAIFISPNAVDHAVPVILAHGAWPATLTPAAVGPGTVKALAAHGINGCLAPAERFDSEGLLALPALAGTVLAGRRVAIFRGDGGRELLAETLQQRGAQVDCITCYQRSGPTEDLEQLLKRWRQGQLAAITLSSSEALRHLLQGLDAEGLAYLQATPLFVPHPRIADVARQAGLTNIQLTAPADHGLLAGLCAYNWSA